MFKRLLHIVKLWPEFWSIPAGILLWVLSPALLRWIDPVAAAFDAGVLQVLVFATIGILLFNGVVFGGLLANFPAIFKFYNTEFTNTFNQLTPWQKCLFLLVFS